MTSTSQQTSGNSVLDIAIKNWLEWDKNVTSHQHIQKLYEDGNFNELDNILLKRMEFGTAGLRAEMGAGNSKMNDLTIIQTTQGFYEYLFKRFGNDLKEKGVIIGFDSRHNSRRFAALAANVFVLKGVKVYLYSKIVPTPFVPYGVVKFQTCAGIMVTASHNPKQDNGYKVYWDNGAQIIPPHDSGIAQCILENLQPACKKVWNDEFCHSSSLLTDPFDDVMGSYYEDLTDYCHHRSVNQSTSLRFTYTPVHGVGLDFARRSFQTFDLPMFEDVPEQMYPDPEFSTVKYPNPEEGKGVLTLSMRTADATGCRVILANDPDADRLAVAEKQKDGHWKVFTGNEIGTLLGWWAWHCYISKNPDADRSNVYMLSSTVSSMILQSVASVEGFSFEDTLTGFKWMGNRTDELVKQGKTVLFAFEEAIGFMYGNNVLDKDGVSAMSVIAECACVLDSKGCTLSEQLQNLYDKYGEHVSNNSYYISHDSQKTDLMFARLRNYCDDNNNSNAIIDKERGNRYPKKLGRFDVSGIRDITTGFDSRFDDGKAVLPVSPGSHMITFYFANESVLTIRTSGTEPKIKYYSEMRGKGAASGKRSDLISELDQLVASMRDDFYQPERNGFLSRST
ncbi:unnamed protein product [Clavelina lepadiformis]|uniref:Phosphoglucomutase-2 n=1 Tax=Clavelina lepadiformis TaxID=159417 RepID=A0ABP0FYD2_CLALP